MAGNKQMSAIKKIIRKLVYNRNDKTRFKLVLRNWAGAPDINILSRALQTETFRSYVKHTSYEPSKNKNYLVLAPHQDDELIGAGGLLLKARDIGAKTAICFVTNGAQNNLVLSGELYSPSDVVEIRRKEALTVCDGLGAEFYELNIDNISMEITRGHINKLSQIITRTQPDIILCPWIFDGSAKHRVVNQLLYHACETGNFGSGFEVWGYQVNNPIFSNIVVNITDNIGQKNKFLNIYKSQNTGIKNYTHLAEGLAAWNSRYLPSKAAKGEKQYAELFMTLTKEEFENLVREYYVEYLDDIYFQKIKFPNNI